MKHSVLHNDRTHPLNPDESSYVHLTTPWIMLTSLFVWFFYLFMHCRQAYVCTLVIYNQSPISPLNVSTCSYSLYDSIYDLSLLPLAWNPATLLAPVLLPTLRAAPAAGTVALTLAVTPGATSPSPAAVHTGPISTQAIGWCHLPWPPVSG